MFLIDFFILFFLKKTPKSYSPQTVKIVFQIVVNCALMRLTNIRFF